MLRKLAQKSQSNNMQQFPTAKVEDDQDQ